MRKRERERERETETERERERTGRTLYIPYLAISKKFSRQQ